MSVADFGLLGSVLAASLLLSVVGSLGQQQALVRFIPPMLKEGRAHAVAPLVGWSLGLTLGGGLAIWGALVLGLLSFAVIGRAEQPGVLAFGLLIVPLIALIDFQAYLARAYKAVLMAVLPKDILWRLVSLSILIPLAMKSDSERVSLWTVFFVLIAVLLVLIAMNATIGPRVYRIPSLKAVWAARKTGFDSAGLRTASYPFWMTSVSSVVFTNIDVVMVAILVSPEAAALYFAANRIAQAPGFFQQSYNIVVSPVFAEQAAAGNTPALRHTALQATRHTFLPTVALGLLLAVLAEPVLALFGPAFPAAGQILLILLLASIANVAFGQADLLLSMGGHERAAMSVSQWSTLLGLAIILTGTHLADETGTALGVLFATFFRKAWFWSEAVRRHGIRCDIVTAMRELIGPRAP